jgi:predicted ArsR family transcriptional regulator
MVSTEQPTFWDHLATPPSTRDSMSRAAAGSVSGIAGTLRRQVAEYIRDHGPVAEWTIEGGLGLRGNTVRPRIWELSNARLIEHRGRGLTPSGRSCHLYALTPLGRSILEGL